MSTTRNSTDTITLFSSADTHFRNFLKRVSQKSYSRFDLSSFFLTQEGDIYVRGSNWEGQLGLGDNISRFRSDGYHMPIKIEGLPRIKMFSLGFNSSYLIDQKDKVYAFGGNKYGSLGLGHLDNVTTPTLVKFLESRSIVKIESWLVTYFLNCDGKVYYSGQYDSKEPINTTPKKIHGLPPISKIVCNSAYDLFLSPEGDVYRRGNNRTTGNRYPDTLMTKLQYTNVKDIQCTFKEGPAVLTQDGKIYIGEKDKPLENIGEEDKPLQMPPVERMLYGHYHGDFNIFELKNGDVLVKNNRYYNRDSVGLYNERCGIDDNLGLPYVTTIYEANSEIAKKCKAILDAYDNENRPILFKQQEKSLRLGSK